MCPANERWCYIVTSSLIGWAHIQNDPCVLYPRYLQNHNYKGNTVFNRTSNLMRVPTSFPVDKSVVSTYISQFPAETWGHRLWSGLNVSRGMDVVNVTWLCSPAPLRLSICQLTLELITLGKRIVVISTTEIPYWSNLIENQHLSLCLLPQ